MSFEDMKRIFIIIGICLLAMGVQACKSRKVAEGQRLFATEVELEALRADGGTGRGLLEAIKARAKKRAAFAGLMDDSATTEWWHHVSEYLSDAAIVHAAAPSRKVDEWLKANVMDLVRRPVADWAGPPFRRYRGGPMTGSLETAHLSWSISLCLDMAGDLFSDEEKEEIREALRKKGLIPCRRYLESNIHYHNWNCVLFAGFAVTAAVLQDSEALGYAKDWYPVALDHFQADGSFGETLQYSNYAAYAITLAREALMRAGVLKDDTYAPYAKIVEWQANACLYRKEMSRWPVPACMPQSINFGDCAATFRPSGDLLMHIASRAGQELPVQAGIAAWLFDRLYRPVDGPAVHDMASFGFINDFGFLSVLLASKAAKPISPAEAGFPSVRAFSAGDAFLRDGWDGETVLGFRMAQEPLHASGHLHGDINSLQLHFRQERMLADPGHSCYRNITRKLDVESASHNTCTFTLPDGSVLQQKTVDRRSRPKAGPEWGSDALCKRGGKRLICKAEGPLRIVASDAAALYGEPIKEFTRCAVLCGSKVVFVIDRIRASVPVKTNWNWLLDNSDGALEYGYEPEGTISATRGEVTMSLQIFGGEAKVSRPVWALVHDAYHSLPAQFCEGKPGSGISFRISENEPSRSSLSVHIITLDDKESAGSWGCSASYGCYSAVNDASGQRWTLSVSESGPLRIESTEGSWSFEI